MRGKSTRDYVLRVAVGYALVRRHARLTPEILACCVLHRAGTKEFVA